MDNSGLSEKVKDELTRKLDVDLRRRAPNINEDLRSRIYKAVSENPYGNSFNDSDQNKYRVDMLFNNGLINLPEEPPKFQERYLELALYYFENYPIQTKADDPILSALQGVRLIYSNLLGLAEPLGLKKDSSFFTQILDDLLQVYEDKTDELKKSDSSCLDICNDLTNIWKKANKLYHTHFYYVQGDVPEGYEEYIPLLKKIAGQESELRKPDIIVKIWGHVKQEHTPEK